MYEPCPLHIRFNLFFDWDGLVNGLGFDDACQSKVGKAAPFTVVGPQMPAQAGIGQSKGAQGLG